MIKCPHCEKGETKSSWDFPIITQGICPYCAGTGSILGWSPYLLIKDLYGEKKTTRSKVPLINHINEGLFILNKINADFDAALAYCIHPIFQSDFNLDINFDKVKEVSSKVICLTMEYRSVANEYLSNRIIKDCSEIRISPLKEVTQMLIADKIQNRKDFELYHLGTHPRSKELVKYFNNWMLRLNISEQFYQETKEELWRINNE